MMNMRSKCNIIFLLCSIFNYAQQPTRTYERELLGITDLWHKIDLPVSAFAKASPYLNDLRIKGITAGNDTVFAPYILKTTDEQTVVAPVDFKIINQSNTGNTYYYTFQRAGKEVINHINLNLKNTNFNWTASLEGSNTDGNWFTILENYRIINIDNDYTTYNFTKLDFPNSQYNNYRVAIKATEKPDLTSATLQLITKKDGVFNTYNVRSTITTQHKEDKHTVLFVTLEDPAPVSNITFTIKNKTDYYRAIRIQYVTDSTQTEKGWIRNYGNLLSSTLSSQEPSSFKIPSNYLKQLRIIIENEDNEPLDIAVSEVKGYLVSLITRIDKPAKYVLAYGDRSLSAPKYDISAFENDIPINLKPLALGNERTIKTFAKKAAKDPLITKIVWLWIVLGIIMVLIAWYTYKMTRKKPKLHNYFD